MKQKDTISRRNLIVKGGISSLGIATLGLTQSGCVPPDHHNNDVVVEQQLPPLAVAMWDFSWLTRRSGAENEYLDFDTILDGFVERGYNCLRIEAYPYLIADSLIGDGAQEFLMLPQLDTFMWGNHSEVTINPKRDLIVFMTKCRERGIKLGLSSWFQPDATHRERLVQSPQQMAQVWIETLDWIAAHGLLDTIAWVDFCNEFPFPIWAPGPSKYMNRALRSNISNLNFSLPFTKAQADAISDYMSQSIKGVRQAYPGLLYCYSFGGLAANYKKMDLSEFDCLEPHIWLNQNNFFSLNSGLLNTLLAGLVPIKIPNSDIQYVYPKAHQLYFDKREKWLAIIDQQINAWASLANKWQLPVITTEAWGPINYADVRGQSVENDEEWRWVFDVCEQSIAIAKRKGWSGICSSNFCQPHHAGFYQNVAWHHKQTQIIMAN